MAISVNEYLNTSYRPDCDYIDGELLDRNVGERDHSRLQGLLSCALFKFEKERNIFVVISQRVRITPTRFRVPDILAISRDDTGEQILTRPPFLCVEIISPHDRVMGMHERIEDYRSFGVKYIWLINPRTRQSFVYTPVGIREAKDGILMTENLNIRSTFRLSNSAEQIRLFFRYPHRATSRAYLCRNSTSR